MTEITTASETMPAVSTPCARRCCRAVSRRKSVELEMESDKAAAFLNLGMMALQNGHDVEAVRSFRRALAARADIVEAYIGLGLAHIRMDEHGKTVEAFRKSIEINPSTVREWAKSSIPGPSVWLSFSPEYTHIKGKMAEFLRQMDEADALARLGAIHISNGMYNPAITALDYCLVLAPDYEAAIILLTIAYLLLEVKEKGKVADIIKNSVFQRIAPKLARAVLS